MSDGGLTVTELKYDAIPHWVRKVARYTWCCSRSEEIKRPPLKSIRSHIVRKSDSQGLRALDFGRFSRDGVAVTFAASGRTALAKRLLFIALDPSNPDEVS